MFLSLFHSRHRDDRVRKQPEQTGHRAGNHGNLRSHRLQQRHQRPGLRGATAASRLVSEPSRGRHHTHKHVVFISDVPVSALTDPNANAAQQAMLQQQLNVLAYSPYGDSPLFRNPLSDPKKKEEVRAAVSSWRLIHMLPIHMGSV